MWRQILKPLASLRLTVVLLALSMVLVFAGTLVQVHQGVWETVEQYFRSLVVWIDFQLFVPPSLATVPGSFPFPGGYTLGGLVFINLIAAHILHFKLTLKRVGVILLHAGLVILLLGELFTGLWAEEGNMTIYEGQSTNYVEDVREVELALADVTQPGESIVTAIPESLLVRYASEALAYPGDLPLYIRIVEWMPNSELLGPAQARAANLPPQANAGLAQQLVAREVPVTTGVEGQNINAPSLVATFLDGQGREVGTYLLSLWLESPQQVVIGDRTYEASLRFKRTYKPYTMHLIDFSHDKFVGTEKPRNFSSHLRLVDPSQGEDREVLIYMNNPLRYGGETFYQAAFKEGDRGTVLQVVRNPAWTLPYIACVIVTVGLLWQFLTRLADHLRKSRR